jgi:Ubiquitin-binding WIYLD domain
MGSKTDRARAALNAMKLLGFNTRLATQVLKELLKLYQNNWELIEDENYRVFAEAILDAQVCLIVFSLLMFSFPTVMLLCTFTPF